MSLGGDRLQKERGKWTLKDARYSTALAFYVAKDCFLTQLTCISLHKPPFLAVSIGNQLAPIVGKLGRSGNHFTTEEDERLKTVYSIKVILILFLQFEQILDKFAERQNLIT